MELLDGFIVGIYNYCDRWCETCAFTSRCRIFAAEAACNAAGDPTFASIADTSLPTQESLEPPPWTRELVHVVGDASRSAEALREEPTPPCSHHVLLQLRSSAYGLSVHRWFASNRRLHSSDPTNPFAVIGWFASMVGAKVGRAVFGLASFEPANRGRTTDHEGSAKIALISIERSHAAWLTAVEQGAVTVSVATPFIGELVWLGEELERVFPGARAFVRPGFDEPEAMVCLEGDGGVQKKSLRLSGASGFDE